MKHESTDADKAQRSTAQQESQRQTEQTKPARGHPLETLHRSVGNQAVQALFESGRLQAKLEVSNPDDPAEREAERVADEVMRMEASRRDPSVGEVADVQRSGVGDSGGETLTDDTEARVRSSLGGGKPLPETTRTTFESRFGRDFSDVRVYTGQQADEAARSINAEAFTMGTDVAFTKGNYDPESSSGRKLLAHELTHVAQQRQKSSSVQRFFFGSDEDEDLDEALGDDANLEEMWTALDLAEEGIGPFEKFQERIQSVEEHVEKTAMMIDLCASLVDDSSRKKKLYDARTKVLDLWNDSSLGELNENLESIREVTDSVSDVIDFFQDFKGLLDDLDSISTEQIANDPERAAENFDSAFASLGEVFDNLGGSGLTGLLGPYFGFMIELGESGFFSNMTSVLNAELRRETDTPRGRQLDEALDHIEGTTGVPEETEEDESAEMDRGTGYDLMIMYADHLRSMSYGMREENVGPTLRLLRRVMEIGVETRRNRSDYWEEALDDVENAIDAWNEYEDSGVLGMFSSSEQLMYAKHHAEIALIKWERIGQDDIITRMYGDIHDTLQRLIRTLEDVD